MIIAAPNAACDREGSGRTELWGSERPVAPAWTRSIPLPRAVPEGATIHADARGRVWIGRVAAVSALDAGSGEFVLEADLETSTAARVVGESGGRLYLRAGDELFTIDTAGTVRARRSGLAGAVLEIDPLGRHLYLATDNGAVIGLDPRRLQPLWAWPRLGRLATAAASSPEGDRFYHALAAAPDAEAAILARDVQTGRVLHETTLGATVRDLQATDRGDLFAVLVGEATELVALRPGPTGLELVWRRELAEWAGQERVEVRVGPGAGRLVAFAAGLAGGLRAFDAASGEPLGESFPAPLDAGFGPNDALFVLYPQEVRVLW